MSRSKRQQRRAHIHGQPSGSISPALIAGMVAVLVIGVFVGVLAVQALGGFGVSRSQAATAQQNSFTQNQQQIVATATAAAAENDAMPRVDLAAARRAFDANQAVFVDARSLADYQIGHIKGAINISMYEVDQKADLLPADKSANIITYCSCPHEEEAGVVLNGLVKLGYTNVHALKGGLPLWVQAKYPVEQPK